jgi:hypothetical protein
VEPEYCEKGQKKQRESENGGRRKRRMKRESDKTFESRIPKLGVHYLEYQQAVHSQLYRQRQEKHTQTIASSQQPLPQLQSIHINQSSRISPASNRIEVPPTGNPRRSRKSLPPFISHARQSGLARPSLSPLHSLYAPHRTALHSYRGPPYRKTEIKTASLQASIQLTPRSWIESGRKLVTCRVDA